VRWPWRRREASPYFDEVREREDAVQALRDRYDRQRREYRRARSMYDGRNHGQYRGLKDRQRRAELTYRQLEEAERQLAELRLHR
jgi:hypothetical protein